MSTILKQFIRHLKEQDPRLSESEIARRARVSQSVVNKHSLKSDVTDADPNTYRCITTAYQGEWERFLAARPDLQRQLREKYGWALTHEPVRTPSVLEALLKRLRAS